MYFCIQLGGFHLTLGTPQAVLNALEGERKLINAAKYLIADRGFRVAEPVGHGNILLDDTPQDDELFAALRLISDVVNGRPVFYVDLDECVDALLDTADENSVLAVAPTPEGAARVVVGPGETNPVDYIGTRWPQ